MCSFFPALLSWTGHPHVEALLSVFTSNTPICLAKVSQEFQVPMFTPKKPPIKTVIFHQPPNSCKKKNVKTINVKKHRFRGLETNFNRKDIRNTPQLETNCRQVFVDPKPPSLCAPLARWWFQDGFLLGIYSSNPKVEEDCHLEGSSPPGSCLPKVMTATHVKLDDDKFELPNSESEAWNHHRSPIHKDLVSYALKTRSCLMTCLQDFRLVEQHVFRDNIGESLGTSETSKVSGVRRWDLWVSLISSTYSLEVKQFAPENKPGPKRKGSSFNHLFQGCKKGPP